MERKQQFSNLIYEYYLLRFQFGYYKPGDILPTVETLYHKFSVSEKTVKTALRRLRDEGYISLRGGHATEVLFEQSEQGYRDFVSIFYAKRQVAHADLYASAELIFIPLLLEGLRRMSGEELDSLSTLVEQAETNDLFQFYYLLLRKIENPLIMNLFWETLFFLGFPFSRRKGRPKQYASEAIQKRLRRLIDGAKAQAWDSVRDTLIEFQRGDSSTASHFLEQNAPQSPQEEQISFIWRIYREHPQVCFKLSVQILHEIYMGAYRDQTYLPSYAAIAKKHGISVSTVRRTIETLHAIGAVQPVNGKGVRACPLGKPCKPTDFSNATVRRNLSYYMQAFELARYTCEDVTRRFVTELRSEVKKDLICRLEEELHSGFYAVCPLHFLSCIAAHSSLQGVREIYGIIYGLQLWGAPLNGSCGKVPLLEQATEQFTKSMIHCLKRSDADGCAATIKEFIDGQFTAAEGFLGRQGIYMEDLRLSPSIQFCMVEYRI